MYLKQGNLADLLFQLFALNFCYMLKMVVITDAKFLEQNESNVIMSRMSDGLACRNHHYLQMKFVRSFFL